jgi:hypothetical protein
MTATPHCTVTSGDKVTVKHQRARGHASTAGGTLTVQITCDAPTNATIRASVTDQPPAKRHGRRPKPNHHQLPTISTRLPAGTVTLKLRLPASVVNDLVHGATENVAVTLTTGATRTVTTIGPLHT